ncbi:ABC-2 type transport system ATP-binding protein [Lentzea atacamensis]|uniref:ABC-2 type transport system ATP-binding protein n=1 Tax=Lentzea atacamensis TaxID=531938 RepID=A0ABX9EMK6_9PSEU|nr:ABC transporter ATP-binding protein [Lentzea atacamensis]RAS71356.1 ABC-2 type transport system ATP-binding protein [Lentzea atacamensis]
MRVDVQGLTVRYGDVTAIDDMSFSLSGNKIYGLLGRNGSGKTSLMSVLAGYRRAIGSVQLDGEPVFENAAAMRKVCLVRHPADAADKSDKVSHVLEYGAAWRDTWDNAYALELSELFKIGLKSKVGELSLGQRSAVGAVIGLASRSPLTMLDESHLGMDTPTRYAFYDALLNDFMAHPRTIIVSTHLIEELSSLLEEVVIIDSGRLVLQEEADVLRSRGTEVVGNAADVDEFTEGLTVLSEKSLGRTKSAMVFGQLDDSGLVRARQLGLELGPIALQDLFVHLTEPVGGKR